MIFYFRVPLVPSIYSSFIGGGEEEDSGSNPFGDSDDNDSDFFNDDHDGFEQNSRSPQRHEDYYCSMYNSLDDICFEDSILELFAQEGKVTLDDIANLTRDQILKVVNDKSRKSGLFSIRKDFESLLGKKVYDENGKIVAAGAFKVNLYGKMNVTEAHLEKIKKDSALGDQLSLEQIDDKTREVEDIFIELLVNYRDKFQSPNSSYTLEFIVAKSFPDAVNERITGDIPKVVGSFIIMFAYVGIALGKFSWVDNMVKKDFCNFPNFSITLIISRPFWQRPDSHQYYWLLSHHTAFVVLSDFSSALYTISFPSSSSVSELTTCSSLSKLGTVLAKDNP